MTRVKKNPNPPDQDPDVQQLAQDWNALDRYKKGDRLLPLRVRYTLEQLAPELGCGKKRLRDFEEFGNFQGIRARRLQEIRHQAGSGKNSRESR